MLIQIARKAIGAIILTADRLTCPNSINRSPEKQQRIDDLTKDLALYEMLACPYCVKVRREIKRQSLNIKRVNVKLDQKGKENLIANGGKFQVPCLSIKKQDKDVWLYESEDIVNYLRKLCD